MQHRTRRRRGQAATVRVKGTPPRLTHRHREDTQRVRHVSTGGPILQSTLQRLVMSFALCVCIDTMCALCVCDVLTVSHIFSPCGVMVIGSSRPYTDQLTQQHHNTSLRHSSPSLSCVSSVIICVVCLTRWSCCLAVVASVLGLCPAPRC